MKRVLVTRPEPDDAATAARLSALGLDPVMCPLMVRETLHTSLPASDGFAGLVLTSTNALRALDERGELTRYLDLPVFAVGEKTANAAREFGFAKVTSGAGDADSLIALLRRQNLSGSLFYPSGTKLSVDIAAALAPAGILVITSPVYTMRPIDTPAAQFCRKLVDDRIDAVLFYSRQNAQLFCELVANDLTMAQRADLTMICLSENVASPLLAAKFPRIALADYPSEEGMMALALSFARGQISA